MGRYCAWTAHCRGTGRVGSRLLLAGIFLHQQPNAGKNRRPIGWPAGCHCEFRMFRWQRPASSSVMARGDQFWWCRQFHFCRPDHLADSRHLSQVLWLEGDGLHPAHLLHDDPQYHLSYSSGRAGHSIYPHRRHTDASHDEQTSSRNGTSRDVINKRRAYCVISLTIRCTRAPSARPFVSLIASGMTRLNSFPCSSTSPATTARSSSSLNCEPCK